MNFVAVKNNKVELKNERGQLISTIVNHSAINADISNDGKLIIITFKDGKAILYNEKSSIIKSIVNHSATNAKFNGSDILVTLSNGKTGLYKINGQLIRMMQ